MKISVESATARRWPEVVTAFGVRGSNPDSCWCQRFRKHEESSNQEALRSELDSANIAVGLLAYVNGRPAGWTRVVPRHTLAGICANRALQRVLEENNSAWWVTCVSIRREHRGLGIGTVLLKAAIDHARNNGASVLDGHPVDTHRLKAKPSPSALFTGTMAMFEAAGFHEIARTYPSRPVMRINLDTQRENPSASKDPA